MQRLFLHQSQAALCTLGFIHVPVSPQSLQTQSQVVLCPCSCSIPHQNQPLPIGHARLSKVQDLQRGDHLGQAINESQTSEPLTFFFSFFSTHNWAKQRETVVNLLKTKRQKSFITPCWWDPENKNFRWCSCQTGQLYLFPKMGSVIGRPITGLLVKMNQSE